MSTLLSSSSSSSPSFLPKKQKQRSMNISQTYFLAHTARAKLSREAGRSDHNLRLLVGHANMLDSLMLDLAGAEHAQELLYNQSARHAKAGPSADRHIRWADTVVDVAVDDSDSEDASSDSDSEEDDDDDDDSDYGQDDQFFIDVTPTQLSPVASKTTATPLAHHDEEVEFEDDLEDDYEDLALTRTNSHPQQPPELLSDDESEEDELSPPSPPQPTFDDFSTSEEEEAIVASTFYSKPASTPAPLSQPLLSKSDQPSLLNHRFLGPPRGQERPAVAAC